MMGFLSGDWPGEPKIGFKKGVKERVAIEASRQRLSYMIFKYGRDPLSHTEYIYPRKR